MITIKAFIFNEFQVNTFVLSDASRQCIVIDPGCNSTRQQADLSGYISEQQLQPVMLINTHGHIDHVTGDRFVATAYNIPLAIHEKDVFLLKTALQFADIFGMEAEQPPAPDRLLKEGDEIRFGNSTLLVFHVPGHSPGSVVLYAKEDNLVIAGDVLFNGSIGRSDLPGGDPITLIRGIKEKLMTLPRETIVYPGHGPSTTIGHEYDTNPFLQGE
jgi:glyoxylase-like metal-dependent hydrolase (beta-lactamase superfamily II)